MTAKDMGFDPEGATCAIQGWGNAAQYAALELDKHGTKIIAVCDSRAGIINKGRFESMLADCLLSQSFAWSTN